MNSILQALVVNEEAVVGHRYDHALSARANEVNYARNGEETINNALKVLKVFAALVIAPFIALGYVIALPVIGLYQFAKLALEAYAKSHPAANGKLKKAARRVRSIGLFFASPFIALAYVVAMPFVGMYMFAKLALEARANSRLVNS